MYEMALIYAPFYRSSAEKMDQNCSDLLAWGEGGGGGQD